MPTSPSYGRSRRHFLKTASLAALGTGLIPGHLARAAQSTPPESLNFLPGRPASDLYSLTVNGRPICTEKFRTDFQIEKLPTWFSREPHVSGQQELHIADFSAEGRLEVTITLPQSPVTVSVHPLSRGITPQLRGKQITLQLIGPEKLYIQADQLPPLCLFANPPEVAPPAANDPTVRYFGPGVHHPGLMTLRSNETVYLAAGALVYGGIRGERGARNLKVLGRGVLDGGAKIKNMVRLEDCHGVEVRGITVRNGDDWTNTLVNCTDVTYEGVKVISFGPGGDGINPVGSSKVRIKDCFLRCTDDCIAIKAPVADQLVADVVISKCTMVGFAYSDGVTIGFETNGPSISGVRVIDCDIILSRGGSRVEGGHAAFSIICDGPALIHDILYENIRVEANVQKLCEFHITDGTKYGDNPPGRIRGVTMRGVTWSSRRPIILKGFSPQNMVEDVTFDRCSIAGEPLISARSDSFQINPFVRDVFFK